MFKCKRHETSYLYRESLIRITYLETVFVELLLTECLKIWFCIIYAQFPTFPVATIECSPTLFNSGRCSVQRYIGETAALWLSSFHGKLIQQNIDFLYFSKTSKTTFNIIDRYVGDKLPRCNLKICRSALPADIIQRHNPMRQEVSNKFPTLKFSTLKLHYQTHNRQKAK